MAGFSTANNEHLIRSNLWTSQLKHVLQDDLMANRYAKQITDFPDGDTLNMPSIGTMDSADYVEGQAVRYTAMDTGNFTFTITQYKQSGTFITNKMKQDSYYMSALMSEFVPAQARAIAVDIETDILAQGPAGQTLTSTNAINGAEHRWIGKGLNETLTSTDFAKARYALKKANVPMEALTAIVDPSVAFALETQTNLVNMSNNPGWQGIVKTGITTGMRYITTIYGFDVYESNYLKVNAASEAISGVTAAAGVNNLFFSASASVLPIVMSVRQPPKVDSRYNQDFQREEFVTTCRWGTKIFRPENMVCIVTDTDQVT